VTFGVLARFLALRRISIRVWQKMNSAGTTLPGNSAGDWLRSRRVVGLLLLLLTIGPVFCGHYFYTPYWQSNDDPFMEMTLRGFQLPGGPSPFVVYSNMLWSWPIAGLYRLSQEIPWYFLAHLVARLVSCAVVMRLVLSAATSWQQVLIAGVYAFTVDVRYCVFTQFTETAALVAGAGMLTWMRGPRGLRTGWWQWSAAVVGLLVVGGLIRGESAKLLMAIGLPAGLCLLVVPVWRRVVRLARQDRSAMARTGEVGAVGPFGAILPRRWLVVCAARCAVLAVAAGAIVAVDSVNRGLYAREPGFSEFIEYNALMARLVDYGQMPYREETLPAFAELGWSENDYALATAVFRTDTRVYSLENFRKLANWFAANVGRIPNEVSIEAAMAEFLGAENALLRWLPLASLLLLRHRPRSLLAAGVMIATLLFVYYYLALYMKLPGRVFRPSSGFFLLFLLTNPARARGVAGPWGIAAGVIGVCLLGMAGWTHLDALSDRAARFGRAEREYRAMIRGIGPFGQEPGLVFVEGCALPYEAIPAYEGPQDTAAIRRVWIPYSRVPVWEEQRKAWGVEDVMVALVRRPGTTLLGSEWVAARVQQCLYERYGILARVVPLTENFYPIYGGLVRLFRFEVVEPPQSPREPTKSEAEK
jgi:hypothetical protein